MPISEAQFKAMTKGTVHEGRYDVPSNEATLVVPVAPDSTPNIPVQPTHYKDTNGKEHTHKNVETAAGVFMKVLPWAVGIRLLTNPLAWFVVLVFLLVFAAFIETTVVNTIWWIENVGILFTSSRTWAVIVGFLLIRKWWKSRK